ncbi:MAG: STN domain-containing protein [Chitinophagaceae bacterium]|nr:STN domain-containing protein [Chitinophagaceae bacterium]
MTINKSIRRYLVLLILCMCAYNSPAQNILGRTVSVDIRQQRLDDALSIISNRANFSFSYNSNILRRDSLVSLPAGDYTIRQALKQLLGTGYEYKESGNYVILRRVAIRLTSVVQQNPATDNTITITGYIVNGGTGEKIGNASIYEPVHLASTLTNKEGKFSIKLKSRHRTASLSVSKDAFEDTTVTIQPAYNMQLEISLVPVVNARIQSTANIYQLADSGLAMPVIDTFSIPPMNRPQTVEQTRLAKLFLTARQKAQSLNIRKFFTEKSMQVSVVPGLSTNGSLGSQVISKFSFNVLGGYTGGVEVAEAGGIFNINRKNTQFAQVAGVFNLTGGEAKGVQVAGIHNTVLQQMNGVQVAGISNHVKHHVTGLQAAGISNINGGDFKGVQLSGIINYNAGSFKGLQAAGIVNYTKNLRGVQVGLINIADSSDGYSIGLVNIILKGYHKVSVSTNETTNLNISFKTGSTKLYSILQAGTNAGNRNGKLYTAGYGLGTEIKMLNRLSVNPELSSSFAYLGNWDHSNILNRFNLQCNFNLGKKFSVFAGPSFTLYYSDQKTAVDGYKFPVVSQSTGKRMFNNDNLTGWIGWNAGIHLF